VLYSTHNYTEGRARAVELPWTDEQLIA